MNLTASNLKKHEKKLRMKYNCNTCDGLKMIVTGTCMWILNEEIIEEDKWDICPVCTENKDGNDFYNNLSEKK